MSVLVCTCFGCTCICVHALYVHPHVYLVYMLAICSLLVTQILYNSIVHLFDLYSSDSATSVHHSPPHIPRRTAGWCHVYIHMYIYYTICLYCISNCNFVFASCLCSRSRLHLPLPHLGPFQVPRHLLAHQKQKYNLQVGIVQCKSYVCNTFNFMILHACCL